MILDLVRRLSIAAILALASGAFIASASAESEFGLLVPGEGAEETFGYCTACHSERIVVQQGQTREGWVHLLEWMVEEQGMPPIEEPDYSLVLDYLTTNYNTDRPNFPRR